MKNGAHQLLLATLADLNREISRLRTAGDFLDAEDLERFKREFFIENKEGATRWTRRALNRDALSFKGNLTKKS